jgi:spore cortex protein
VGLTGCANDDQAEADKNHKNKAQPIGYYSNENHPEGRNGFLSDNDGPLPEAMDHTIGDEDREINDANKRALREKDENGNPKNPTRPMANHDHNFFHRDNRFSTSDANYHGHMNQRLGTSGTTTKPEFQDKAKATIKNKAAEVDNVQQVRSVVYGNSVIVSVELVDHKRSDETKRDIQNAVKPYVGGRQVQVIVDEGALGRDRNRNNDIQRPEHKPIH